MKHPKLSALSILIGAGVVFLFGAVLEEPQRDWTGFRGISLNQSTYDVNFILNATGDANIMDGGLVLSDSDIAHGITGLSPTNAYGKLEPLSGAYGGLFVHGISGNAGTSGLLMRGIIGVTDPTDSIPAILYQAGKSDAGTSGAPLGNAETIFQVANWSTPVQTILGNGNFGIGTTSPSTKLEVVGDANITGDMIVLGDLRLDDDDYIADVNAVSGNLSYVLKAYKEDGTLMGYIPVLAAKP